MVIQRAHHIVHVFLLLPVFRGEAAPALEVQRHAVGNVGVHGNNNPVVRRIGGQDEVIRSGIGSGRVIGGNHEIALGVLAAGSADHVHKRLVVCIDAVHRVPAFLLVPVKPPFPVVALHARLVHALKDQVLVIVPEPLRHLGPDAGQECDGRLPVRIVRIVPVHTVVMMGIDDDIQSCRKRLIHQFLHPVQPGRIAVHTVAFQMIVPGHRNAHSGKARLLQGMEDLRIRIDAAPVLLNGQIIPAEMIVIGIHGIAKVPAAAKLPEKSHGRIIRDLKLCRLNIRNHHFRRARAGGHEKTHRQDQNQKTFHYSTPSAISTSLQNAGLG